MYLDEQTMLTILFVSLDAILLVLVLVALKIIKDNEVEVT
jgi:hypothetical protein